MGNRDTEPLRRGNAFHARVQTAFLAGLLGAEAAPERPITLSRTRSGRVDLLILPSGGEVAAVIVEIKSTDWDTLAERRVRPNLRSTSVNSSGTSTSTSMTYGRSLDRQRPASGTASAAARARLAG